MRSSTAPALVHISISGDWSTSPRFTTLPNMNPLLAKLVESGDGLVMRDDALATFAHHVVDKALESGRLHRVLPRTYLHRDVADDPATLTRAAINYAGVPVAASHLTALSLWRLAVPPGLRIHLMTGETRHLRGSPHVIVHRRDGFRIEPPQVVVRGGTPVTNLEMSIVDSWPILDKDAKRAPAILAVAQRMTTVDRLRDALRAAPRLAGRRYLTDLIDKLAAGCRSPLELWGYDRIFTWPDLPRLRWQVPVDLGGRTVYLDVFDDVARINFELDGAKYHSSPLDRERDLRRDAALATRGITVVRFTHNRLVNEPDEVRREILSITRAHRRP